VAAATGRRPPGGAASSVRAASLTATDASRLTDPTAVWGGRKRSLAALDALFADEQFTAAVQGD
jgi:hypothetical protein